MCLIAFSYKQHPAYDLIFAANRDEFYKRPTREARFWDEYPNILAGKDLKAGGTWMGLNRAGQFAALTNYRDPSTQKDRAPSRGKLVLNYLIDIQAPTHYIQKLKNNDQKYNGFNLIFGSAQNLFYYSNNAAGPVELQPGLFGLSNKLLDTPWPKVIKAKETLSNIVREDTIDEEALFELLENDQQAPEYELPDTGISKELERAVSSIFIKTDSYGTRCSTILLINKNGKVTFEERRYKPGTMEIDDTSRFIFKIGD